MAFQNFYATKLQTPIGASDTSIVVQTPPTALTGRLVLEPRSATQREIISYTGVAGVTLTGVTRGLFGTTAKPHTGGALVEMNFLAEDYQDLVDAYDSFVATNNDWRSLIQVPTMVSSDGQRQHKLRYTGVDYRSIIGEGAKLRIPRTGTTPTTSMAFVAASSQYASKTSPTGITFTDDFTCEAWVYLDSYTAGEIISRYDGTNGGFLLGVLSDGRPRIWGKATGFSNDEATAYQSIPLGKWTHIAGTLDLSAGTGNVYIDGVLVPSAYTNGTSTGITHSGNLQLGAFNGANNLFNGKIANARVWSTVRTAAQIRDNMNQETPASTTGLVAHFKGNGSWNDSSSNANHLTAVGGAVNNSATHPYSATEYAIVTKVEYTGGNTDVTVFTGSNCLPNEALGATSYSTARAPYGFPSAKSKWTIESHLRVVANQSAPATNQWYNLSSWRLTVPSGEWNGNFTAAMYGNRPSGDNQFMGTLSTSATAETNSRFTQVYGSNPGTDTHGTMNVPVPMSHSAQTTWYALMKTSTTSMNQIYFLGDRASCVISAECAYL